MLELRRRAPLRGRLRGDSPPGRHQAVFVWAAVVLAAGLLLSAARLWGQGGGERPLTDVRTPARAGNARGGLAVSGQKPAGATASDSARGFSHRLHRPVRCTSCHVSGSSHGALKVRTREDCLACHHSPARATGCTTCHESDRLPGPVSRTVPFRTSVAPGVSARTLPFAHAFHAAVACGDCHDGSLERRPVKDCTSCHERHHTAARDCQRCHRPEDVKGHPARAHNGCGGGGCHADPAVTALSWSRTVCTSCHQDQTRHQPGRDCATCHEVPALHENGKEVAR